MTVDDKKSSVMVDLKLKIDGMSCSACAFEIEKAVGKIDGVSDCSVNYALGSARIACESGDAAKKIEQKVSELGYSVDNSVKGSNPALENDSQHGRPAARKFLLGFILSIIIFLLEMGPLRETFSKSTNWLFQFILATPVWLWIGLKFQKALIVFLRSGRSNMNTLIGIGTSAAYLYSSFLVVFSDYSLELGLTQKVYFEAVGFIISFVLLGQFFEEKAKRKTKDALNALFSLSAKDALKVSGDEVTMVKQADVMIGDILRVKPGASVPVDGIITKGRSNIDESMLSGESIPVAKNSGDAVYTGTLNFDGTFDYRVTKVGKDTFLAKIIDYVEMAQNAKPRIQRLADKVGEFFTPVVIAVALVTFFSWIILSEKVDIGMAISNFIAVLVIACPCALGLATPTAVVVATGRASLKGLLIGGGEVLEKADQIDTIVFDKTGTLTLGKPSVLDLATKDVSTLGLVASIAQFSEHPLSKAVVNYAASERVSLSEPDSFEVFGGKGIHAELDGSSFLIGSEAFLNSRGVKISEKLSVDGLGSMVFAARDEEHVATFLIGDEIKKEAAEVIERLHKLGVKTVMLTGDNSKLAEDVAKKLSIGQYFAEVLPLEKTEKIEELIKDGSKVAMVGDGVNDAPALALADLSFAMGTGTEAATTASDVTIVNGDIRKILDFLALANKTMRIIKQNLFLSFVYNISLVPIAAGVLVLFGGPLMPPVFASIAMALSSISVVSNSLRIRRFI